MINVITPKIILPFVSGITSFCVGGCESPKTRPKRKLKANQP